MSNLLKLTRAQDMLKQVSKLQQQIRDEIAETSDPLFTYPFVLDYYYPQAAEVFTSGTEGLYFLVTYVETAVDSLPDDVYLLNEAELAQHIEVTYGESDTAFEAIREAFNAGDIPVGVLQHMDECDLERFIDRKSMTEEAKDHYVMSKLLR